jgi:hypothetical protein
MAKRARSIGGRARGLQAGRPLPDRQITRAGHKYSSCRFP